MKKEQKTIDFQKSKETDCEIMLSSFDIRMMVSENVELELRNVFPVSNDRLWDLIFDQLTISTIVEYSGDYGNIGRYVIEEGEHFLLDLIEFDISRFKEEIDIILQKEQILRYRLNFKSKMIQQRFLNIFIGDFLFGFIQT